MQTECTYPKVRLIRRISRQIVFKSAPDYREFIHILNEGRGRQPVNVAAFCLLPNSVNLLLDYSDEVNVSRFLQWIFTTHAKRYQAKHDAEGSLWRGRVQSIPVQTNETQHLVRHVFARLPHRYRLLNSQDRWPWARVGADVPGDEPTDSVGQWKYRYIKHCIEAGTPVGDPDWLLAHGLVSGDGETPKRRGRPPKRVSHQ